MTDTAFPCPSCGAPTVYQAFSGGREYWCPACADNGDYPATGDHLPRATLLRTPAGVAALREQMDAALDQIATHPTKGPGMSQFEDQLMAAVVAQFFTPVMHQTPTFNPQTGQHEMQTTYGASAAARVAHDIWTAKQHEIVRSVQDRLSVDDIAEALAKKITDDIVERMTTTRMYHGYDKDREQMRALVNARIADELARRALAKMDDDEFQRRDV